LICGPNVTPVTLRIDPGAEGIAIYLAYGSYSFPTGAALIGTRCRTEFAPSGRPATQTYTFSVRATIVAENQSSMKTAILALEAAHRVKNQNVVLYQDDGSASALILSATNSLSGVRVIEGPSYPTTEGAENALFRTVDVTYESSYLFGVAPDGTGSPDVLDSFIVSSEETLTISGGGATYIHKPNVLGPWQKQLVYPQTPWVAVQAGTVVGLRAYPSIPPPVFPAALKETNPRISRKSPRQEGYMLRDYAVSYEYSFESVAPLVGLPHYWRSL